MDNSVGDTSTAAVVPSSSATLTWTREAERAAATPAPRLPSATCTCSWVLSTSPPAAAVSTAVCAPAPAKTTVGASVLPPVSVTPVLMPWPALRVSTTSPAATPVPDSASGTLTVSPAASGRDSRTVISAVAVASPSATVPPPLTDTTSGASSSWTWTVAFAGEPTV